MSTISFLNVKKYYKGLEHQKGAVEYLGTILLKTPAKKRLKLIDPFTWIKCSDEELVWLERQISKPTLQKFTSLWRADDILSFKKQVDYYRQLDNKFEPYASCNSSAHAMFTDFCLEKAGRKGLNSDDEYVRRVYSNKYGTYGYKRSNGTYRQNNSMSWDVQMKVVKSFGVKAQYTTAGKAALINELVNKQMICPAGFWHRGTLSRPKGGHIVTLTDYNPKKGFLVYDPFGTRMPTYKNQGKGSGIYWLSEREFNVRWQKRFTKFLGLI